MIGIPVAAHVSAGDITPNSSSDIGRAQDWLGLIDAGRWDESWTAAGTLFRSRTTQAAWSSLIKPVREPLGHLLSRSLKSVVETTSLPGAPDGRYKIVQFSSRFSEKSTALETIILKDEDGSWQIDGYFIR